MRSRLPYVVSLLLLWIWSPSTITAQSLGQKSSQSIQPLPQKALSDTKPLAFQKAPEESKQIFFMDAQGKPRLLAPYQRFIVMEDTPKSAHILIWQAPPDMDTNIILEIPKDFSSNMPIIKGLPPSSADFRGVFINPPQSANPLFAPDKWKQPK